MVSLIKNQILKQLSKFAKNLSSDRIQLSTLKGYFELPNLELDELVLTDVLELPSWLRITRAVCNHVTVKIHWTKLKSVPIHLSLDEVLVETETCEDLRTVSSQSLRQTYGSGGKYGFSDRVIDGMTVVVNSVIISFKSPVFEASIQISRVLLESRTPNWKKTDLRLSRIKNVEHGELLFFKQLDWQVLRIEAKARNMPGSSEVNLTPLRLITNQASCKIAIKKKLSDCSVMGCRIVLVLDDLLWVLTDAQLVAALHFVNSLSQLVQQATELSKKSKAKRKLEQQPDRHNGHSNHPTKPSSVSQKASAIIRYFNQYDIMETSYHIYCGRIDLHLCDDLNSQDGERKSSFHDGGALQVSLFKLTMDYYPYHRAFGSRDHWLRYSEPTSGRSAWMQQLMSLFHDNLQTKFQSDAQIVTDPSGNRHTGSKHASVHRAPPHVEGQTEKSGHGKSNINDGGRRGSLSQYKKAASQWSMKYLMSSCFILRLEDYTVYKVSTSATSKKYAQGKFLGSDKTSLLLPADTKSVHLEMTYYYFPGDVTLSVPTPSIFVHLGPLQLMYDDVTLLWLNTFMLNLVKCIQTASNSSHSAAFQSFLLSLNIRAELLMPQAIIPSDKSYPTQPSRPKALHLQASRIVVTNCRIGDHASRLHLSQCLDSLSHGSMFFERSKYPWKEGDLNPIAEKFLQQMIEKDPKAENKKSTNGSKSDAIMEGHDIWSIHLDPCWADFSYSESGHSKPQTFLDPLPITLWIYMKALSDALTAELNSQTDVNQNGIEVTNRTNGSVSTPLSQTVSKDPKESCDKSIDNEGQIYVLVHIHSLLNVQINHFQYLFLLRTLDSIIALTAQLAEDSAAIIVDTEVPTACLTCWFPQIELSLVLQNITPSSFTYNFGNVPSFHEDNSLDDDLILKKRTLSSTHSSFSLGDCDTHAKAFDAIKTDNSVVETSDDRSFPKSHSDLLLNSHLDSAPLPTEQQLSGTYATDKSDHIQKSIQTGTSAVKKGFSTLMASIDSVLTKNDGNPSDPETASHGDDDTLSVQSDISSDSDQYILVGLESALTDDDPFRFHNSTEAEVEEAAEVKEDSISNHTSLDGEKKKGMISVLTLKLFGVSVAAQFSDNGGCTCIQCHHIDTGEQPLISWENFHNFFSSRSRGWQAEKVFDGPQSDTQISIRFSRKAVSEGEKLCVKDEDFMSLLAKDISLSMLMSSLSGLIDLLEDEIIPEPIPTRIIVSNLKLCLQEDRPSTNITSPGAIPLHFHLPGCILERTREGSVHLLPFPSDILDKSLPLLLSTSKDDKSLPIVILSEKCDLQTVLNEPQLLDNLRTSAKTVSSSAEKNTSCQCTKIEKLDLSEQGISDNHTSLLADPERLKIKINAIKGLEKENSLLKEELRLLRSVLKDNHLHKQLVESRDEVRRLEEEKKSLLATLQVLQEELGKYENQKHGSSF